MRTDELIRELERLKEKHKNDKYGTFETCWIDVLREVISKLKELSKHNLNDSIKVKLTDYGKEIYANRYEAINKTYGKKVIKDTKPRVDAEGYSFFQLWDFMNVFGEFMYMGNTEIVENLEFEFVYRG